MVRQAHVGDLPVLQDIERAAGKPFAELGMHTVAEDEAPGIELLKSFADDGRAWVWVDDADHPVAYLIADLVDGNAHVEQVSVHPGHGRKGIGKALIEHAASWGREQGVTAMTLTSYTHVAWNGPYYERLGFRHLSEDEWTPGLRKIREEEAAHGLDEWPRSCMRREL